MLLQFIINGLITGLLYSLLAIGFALVYNTTKVFHIAAAGIYVFAAYMFWWLSGYMPLWLAGGLSLLLSMGLNYSIDLLVYQPLKRKKASNNIALVSSIGVMTIIVNLLALFFGNEPKSVSSTFKGVYDVGLFSLSQPQLIQVGCCLVLIMGFIVFFLRSQTGLKIKAISEDELLYAGLGYNSRRIRAFAFLLGGFFIAVASCLNVVEVGMDVNMGMNVLITAIVAMIIGGTGKIEACVLGGLTLGLIQSLVLIHFSTSWQNAITFILLLAFLFIRPQGLAGYKQRTV